MKKLIIFTILTAIFFALALELQTLPKNRAKDSDWIFYSKNALDSMAKDSIKRVVNDRIRDSILLSEHRSLVRFDSINLALRIAMMDTTKAGLQDSLYNALINLKNATAVRLKYGSITSPSTDVMGLNETIVSINSDTTYIGLHARTQKLWADSIKFSSSAYKTANIDIMNNGFSISNDLANRVIFTEDTLHFRGRSHFNPFPSTAPNTNEIIGLGAGKTGMSGTNNVIIGYQSGSSMTTGTNNAFSGSFSGYANTTGYNNTFSGSFSGRSNTTGTNNTFNGFYSGFSNTTGYNNTFSGYVSGYANTAGTYNTFSGSFSGRLNTTGYQNTFSGYYSGYANTTGSQNTFISYFSGRANTTGNYNICIGDSTGVPYKTAGAAVYKTGAQPLKTTHRNVLIGHRAALIDSTTSDNFILQSDNGSTVQRLVAGNFANKSFNVNGSINYGGNNASGNDTYAVYIPGIDAYLAGLQIVFRPVTANTGACTVAVNSLGAKAIKTQAGNDPPDDYFTANSIAMLIYDGTNFVAITPDANP